MRTLSEGKWHRLGKQKKRMGTSLHVPDHIVRMGGERKGVEREERENKGSR